MTDLASKSIPVIESGTDGNRPSGASEDGLLVVIVGPDGAGKSSVLAELVARRPSWRCTSITPSDLYPAEGLEYMDWALQTHPREYVAKMGPLTRASFFAHTLSILYESHVQPALRAGRTVICDSYHYRVRAKEKLLNPEGAPLLEPLAARMRRPDLAIWIELPSLIAWRRNGARCDFFESLGEPSPDGFARMQAAVELLVRRSYLRDFPVVTIDGRADLPVVVDQALVAVDSFAANRVR